MDKNNVENTVEANSNQNTEESEQNPNLIWVAVDERDETGRPRVPKRAMVTVNSVRYDDAKHTDLDLILRTGAGTAGEIIGQYKIYDVSKFDMKGRRRVAMATVDLALGRRHEEAWFEAFKGVTVAISDPGVAGSISDEYSMKVTEVSFETKISPPKNHYSLEARLTMKEKLRSVVWRYRLNILRAVLWVVVTVATASLISVVINRLFSSSTIES